MNEEFDPSAEMQPEAASEVLYPPTAIAEAPVLILSANVAIADLTWMLRPDRHLSIDRGVPLGEVVFLICGMEVPRDAWHTIMANMYSDLNEARIEERMERVGGNKPKTSKPASKPAIRKLKKH